MCFFLPPDVPTSLLTMRPLWNSEEITCNQPLLTVDRQMGLNIVHPDGKVRSLETLHAGPDTNIGTPSSPLRPSSNESDMIRTQTQACCIVSRGWHASLLEKDQLTNFYPIGRPLTGRCG